MKIIKRQLQDLIKSRLFARKAIILIGPRQVGKTTLFQQLVAELDTKVLSLNCDEPEVLNMLTDMNSIELKLLIGNNKVVLIDEAQRVTNIGMTLKRITDNLPDVQLLVTGSSSLDLKNKLDETLTGRIYEYNLYPISTGELLADGGLIAAKQSLESRLIFGSYPDVLNNAWNAKEILMNLTNSYLYKDILQLESVRKPDLLNKILIALALQVGSEVKYNEVAQLVSSDPKTVEKYVELLEKCYIIFRLPGLSRNIREELKKAKKIYFYDNGIRNAIIQNFAPLDLRDDKGALWENFCISERKKRNHYSGHYVNAYFWRTTRGEEIDYVEECDGSFTAFEMKWNPKKAKTSLPSAFGKAYKLGSQAVVTPENFLEFL